MARYWLSRPFISFLFHFHILFLLFKPVYPFNLRLPVLILTSFRLLGPSFLFCQTAVRDNSYCNTRNIDPLPAPTGTGSDRMQMVLGRRRVKDMGVEVKGGGWQVCLFVCSGIVMNRVA